MNSNIESAHFSLMQEEAVSVCAELIQIASVNTGIPETMGDGETRCAELIRDRLSHLEAQWVERQYGRGNLLFRIPGTDPARPALLVHAHTDVVPADESLWSFPPFSGEIIDGYVCGRGAVDMKDMIGMLVAALRQLDRENWQPERDIVLAFVADEEAAQGYGMKWLVEEHPELFDGVSEAFGEVGGFSVPSPQGRQYTIGVAEKGLAWATLTAHGVEGHGSMIPNHQNAAAKLVAALERIVSYQWPVELDSSGRDVIVRLEELLGTTVDPENLGSVLDPLGPVSKMFANAFRTTSALTQVHAGIKTNTVPGTAIATVDCRIAPGTDLEFQRTFETLAGPDVEISWDVDQSVTATFDTPLVTAMQAALASVDPDAGTLPFLTGAATDAKFLAPLGISCYGFVPLQLPADFDFPGMFHGIDERVPVSALKTGSVILRNFLAKQDRKSVV